MLPDFARFKVLGGWGCVSVKYFFRYLLEQQQLVQVPGWTSRGSAAPAAEDVSPGKGRGTHKLRVTSVLEEGHENALSHPCLSSQGCLLPHCSLVCLYSSSTLVFKGEPPTACTAERTLFQKHTWRCLRWPHVHSATGRAKGLLCWAEPTKYCDRFRTASSPSL